MRLPPPGTPVRDPFFAAVRRRHPDVDLVVLPPTDETDDSGAGPDDDVVAATLIAVATQARLLWALAAPGSEAEARSRWTYDADPGRVRATSRAADLLEDGEGALGRVRDHLESDGWQVWRLPGPVERFAAALGDLRVEASWVESGRSLAVSVASAPLAVGRDAARDLVRAQRGEP